VTAGYANTTGSWLWCEEAVSIERVSVQHATFTYMKAFQTVNDLRSRQSFCTPRTSNYPHCYHSVQNLFSSWPFFLSENISVAPVLQKGDDWMKINPLNAELNPICHLLVLLGAHHILHVSRIRVKSHLPTASMIRSSLYSPR